MANRTELRRLAEEATYDAPTSAYAEFYAAADPQTVLALLDAAERADRAIELLRRDHPRWDDGSLVHDDDCEECAFLAEVDRAE